MLSNLILTIALLSQSATAYVPVEPLQSETVSVTMNRCSACDCGCECSVKPAAPAKAFRMTDKNGVTYEDVDKKKVIDYVNWVNLNTPYRLTDKFGTVWEHGDYTFLRDYVNKVNAGSYNYSAAACTNGTCLR